MQELQRQLAAVEREYEPLRQRGNYSDAEWEAVGAKATAIRKQLFSLTGDAYGRPKTKKVRPSDEDLNATYASPSDVPAAVRAWVRSHSALLTSDATDAVRWGRIADTLDDERLEEGEVTIYRACAAGDSIRPGDWVTTSQAYAEEHRARYLRGRGAVLVEVVDGRDVLASPTGNDEEAIYAPRDLSGPV